MHLYMKETRVVRFRCSGYPACRTYLKKTRQTDTINLAEAGKKGVLISPSYDIYAFLERVKGMGFADVVYLANQEATEAERRLLRPSEAEQARRQGCEHYTSLLKDLIFFFRYGVKPHGVNPTQFQLFQPVYEDSSRKWVS